MSTFSSFEEIEAWKLARTLTNKLYRVSGRGEFGRDFGLRDQIRKAAVSVMSNIAEGFERDGKNEFHQHLSIAKDSAGEVKSLLYVASDLEYILQEEFDAYSESASEIGRVINGLMTYLRDCAWPGKKFRNPTNSKLGTRNS